jgi:hypothetical protein
MCATYFDCLDAQNIKCKVYLAIVKSLANSKKPFSVALFMELVVALRKPHLTLKIVPKATCDHENRSESCLGRVQLLVIVHLGMHFLLPMRGGPCKIRPNS